MSNDLLQRLPIELCIRIFELCVSADAEQLYNFFFDDTTKAPWVLSQVCSRWRTIVHESPSLWSVVRVSTDLVGGSQQPLEDIVGLLSLYLKRSKLLPISLLVLSEDHCQQDIMKPIIGCCDRWRDAFFFMNPIYLHHLGPIRGRLPLLRSLHFIPTRISDAGAMRGIFEVAPNLEALVLNGPALDLSFSLPWSQIRLFEANYVEPADILTVVPTMPHMLRMYLGREPPERDPVDTTDWEVTHDEVEEVRLGVVGGRVEGHPGDLIDHLVLPAMVDLNISCDSEESVDSLLELLQRSECRIRTLTLDIRFGHSSKLLDLFRNVPQFARLSTLTLQDGDPVDDSPLLTAMTVHEGEAERIILPQLQDLTIITDTDKPGRAVKLWLTVLESRVDPAQPTDPELPEIEDIRSVSFHCKTARGVLDDPACLDRFHRLVVGGVKVEFRYGPAAVC
ncbi:hypothetical protein K523DRAFT_339776 [Schizophyllum commune Tattone D]|nr:hypothetical protein K523DRAFT_339776 [Schizophyllum commune Tattone D]